MTARSTSPDAGIPPKPSQAEGDRETIDEDMARQGRGRQ